MSRIQNIYLHARSVSRHGGPTLWPFFGAHAAADRESSPVSAIQYCTFIFRYKFALGAVQCALHCIHMRSVQTETPSPPPVLLCVVRVYCIYVTIWSVRRYNMHDDNFDGIIFVSRSFIINRISTGARKVPGHQDAHASHSQFGFVLVGTTLQRV